MRFISRGKRKRYWQIVQFSERRELHFLQNYLYSFRLLEKKREIACGTTGDSLVFFLWKRHFHLCVNKKPAKIISILCVHSLYRPGGRWNQNNRAEIVSLTLFSRKKKDIQYADFCIQISFRMFLKFLTILSFIGKGGCSHTKWTSSKIKLKLRRIHDQCPVDVKFCGHSPNLQ